MVDVECCEFTGFEISENFNLNINPKEFYVTRKRPIITNNM